MRPSSLCSLAVLLVASGIVAYAQSAAPSSYNAKPAAASGNAKAAAASGSATAHRALPTVAVTFHTYALDGVVQGAYYRSGTTIIPLSARALTLSPNSYTYAGPDKMEILRPQAKPAATEGSGAAPAEASPPPRGGRGRRGGPPPLPSGPMDTVGTVTFPRNGNYVLFLQQDSTGAVSGIPLSNDPREYPAGSIRFVNTTDFPMAVRIGDGDPVPLKANDFYLYKPKGTDQFVVRIDRTDITDNTSVTGAPMAPPSPGMRTSAFIFIGNLQQVLKENAQPNFNIRFDSDAPGSNQGPPPGGGQGRRGGNRGGTGG